MAPDPSRQPEIRSGLEACGLAGMPPMLQFVATLRAGMSLGLSGRYAVQSAQVRAALDLWASDQRVDLVVIDDQGSPSRAVAAYQALLEDGIDILLGPYGSGTVRRVAPVVCDSGRLLWNHGGAADDLASPLLATVVAPASTYLAGLLVLARDAGLDDVLVAPGGGRFAEHVASGGRRAAERLGLRTRLLAAGDVTALVERALHGSASLADAALVVAGTFDEDVALVRRIREAGVEVGLLGCVAAGIEEFGHRLGRLADGIVGPAQWWCHDHPVDVGLPGPEFVRRFEGLAGRSPDYLAAQAAAAGYLATDAAMRRYGADDVRGWQATTLLGPFRLDGRWRQVGHVPVAVQWRGGGRVLAAGPTV
jgi:ABC-type branched-subunit amino acid transport system substrate-binding protein